MAKVKKAVVKDAVAPQPLVADVIDEPKIDKAEEPIKSDSVEGSFIDQVKTIKQPSKLVGGYKLHIHMTDEHGSVYASIGNEQAKWYSKSQYEKLTK